MKNTDFTEQWTAMQKMFLPTPVTLAPLRENACRFWESQEKVLDSMQVLANSWFERRHTGTHKARETASPSDPSRGLQRAPRPRDWCPEESHPNVRYGSLADIADMCGATAHVCY